MTKQRQRKDNEPRGARHSPFIYVPRTDPGSARNAILDSRASGRTDETTETRRELRDEIGTRKEQPCGLPRDSSLSSCTRTSLFVHPPELPCHSLLSFSCVDLLPRSRLVSLGTRTAGLLLTPWIFEEPDFGLVSEGRKDRVLSVRLEDRFVREQKTEELKRDI